MLGADSDAATVMLMTKVDEPALLVAVTVWFVAEAETVGVPEIWPVLLLKDTPAGNAGLTVHDVAGDPELVGSRLVMAVPTT